MGKTSTIWLHKALLLAFTCAALLPLSASDASAQSFMKGRKEDLPDASGFYMSRRQYQIIDDGPIVRNSAGQIVPANQAGFTSNVGAGRAPLQRAGFMPYSSGLPQYNQQNLPKVNNGVPDQPAPVFGSGGPSALSARANSYKGSKKSASKSSKSGKPTTNTVSAYNTYKGYSPAAPQSAAEKLSTSGGNAGAGVAASTSTSTSVKGSVWHWNKKGQ